MKAKVIGRQEQANLELVPNFEGGPPEEHYGDVCYSIELQYQSAEKDESPMQPFMVTVDQQLYESLRVGDIVELTIRPALRSVSVS